ncbi:MAG TPA: hypothetical protein PKH24_02525 [Sedimentisphaerales bacterium]|jgi:hypothetical protein|nr:hypothetical protein [Sedimentisphaerales bacterium]HNU28292.1 hypothetical protein [Sedimentisphaerales bacterium]
MKRYTGQKALYEAISRSRDKAKQHSILEKLRPVLSKPPTTPGQEIGPAMTPEQTEQTPVQELAEPEVVEMPPAPAVELPLQAEPELELPPEPISVVSAVPDPRVEPAAKPRPSERFIHPAAPTPASVWLRPRPVQFNEGRIEISMPYYVGAIAAMVFLVVVLAAYRIGQGRQAVPANEVGGQVRATANPSGTMANPPVRTPPQNPATSNADRPLTSTPVMTGGAQQDVAPARVQGDNCIVLARSRTKEDFDPVVKHFADHGISVVSLPIELIRKVLAEQGLNPAVLPSGDGHLLVTTDYYSSADVAKTKQRIAEVGKLYKGKAPSGLESFAPNYFSDAYGMKIRQIKEKQ